MRLLLALIPGRWKPYAMLVGAGAILLTAWTLWHRTDAAQAERARQEEITEEREDDISDAIDHADDCADWRQCLRAR